MDHNFYTQHLAEVNQVQGVVTTEDVKNEQGQLVLPAGTPLDQQASDKVLRFKLLKPLENSVAIEQQLTADTLYDAIKAYFFSDDSLRTMWIEHNEEALLAGCCDAIAQHPILMQKLTVLSLQYRRQFNLAVFCAWLAAYIYEASSLNEDDIVDAFIAGCVHDIGMLHLNPDFIIGKRELSSDEWRQLQSHPIVTREIIKSLPNVSNNLIEAVSDHHESIDATGYPQGKISKQINPIAQILNLLDSTFLIYEKHFKPHGRSLNDLIPIVQMNQHYRYNEDANVLIILLKTVDPTSSCFTPLHLMDKLIQHVLDKYDYVVRFLECTNQISSKLGFQHGEKKLLGLQNILMHIHITLTRSGVANEAYMRWIKQVKDEHLAHAYREIEDANLMFTEIIYHTKKFSVSLELLIEECSSPEQLSILSDVYAELSRITQPDIDSELAKCLLNS